MKQDQGLTFDVFRDDEDTPAEEPPAEQLEEEGEEGTQRERAPKEPEEKFPKHKYVKEVVREPRIHYYKVPRLGSYLAIRLEYNSCLFEGALDNAVLDYLDVRARQKA